MRRRFVEIIYSVRMHPLQRVIIAPFRVRSNIRESNARISFIFLSSLGNSLHLVA